MISSAKPPANRKWAFSTTWIMLKVECTKKNDSNRLLVKFQDGSLGWWLGRYSLWVLVSPHVESLPSPFKNRTSGATPGYSFHCFGPFLNVRTLGDARFSAHALSYLREYPLLLLHLVTFLSFKFQLKCPFPWGSAGRGGSAVRALALVSSPTSHQLGLSFCTCKYGMARERGCILQPLNM